jgi:Fusaric acid resistance protein-like
MFAAHLRELFQLGPANRDALSALRVATSVAGPVLLLLALGHTELVIYAVFGAFTAMYGRGETHQLRLRHQLQAAGLLVAGAGGGIALSALGVRSWTLVAVEALAAGMGSLLADKAELKPAGPFFAIFALGACAAVPLHVPAWVAGGVCLSSALFSLLVGFAGWSRHRTWRPGAVRRVRPLRGPALAAAGVHALRYVLAVASAGGLGLLVGLGHPYWAMAAAAVPLAGADFAGRIQRGVHRILGTFAGLVVAASVFFVGLPGWQLALLVILFQFPTELFMTRHYGLALVFFTPLILIMTQLANPADPAALLRDRAVETFLGAVVGILVVLLVRRPSPLAAAGSAAATPVRYPENGEG